MMAIMIIMLLLQLSLAVKQPHAGLDRLCCRCCALSQKPLRQACSQPLSQPALALDLPQVCNNAMFSTAPEK